MTSANEAVGEAIKEALGGSEAESQTVEDKPTPEVKADDKSASDEKATSTLEKGEPKAGSTKDPVPYERFSEVVGQKNDALDKVKSLEGQFQTASTSKEDLQKRLGELETDHQIVKAIKNLAGDERYRPHVVAIDKALQGIDDEVDKAKEAEATGDDQGLKQAEKRYDKKVAKLDALLAEKNAEALWETTDKLAASMLSELPEEYLDEDRTLLSKLWTQEVDWTAIEDKGRDAIPEALQTSFAKLIKDYGTPRGALIKNVKEETAKDLPEKPTSTEEVVKGILAKDWSKTDEKGKPVLSDAEFSSDMGDLMKKVSQA